MSVEVKFQGEVAEVVLDMKRFVGPFLQAEALAGMVNKTRPGGPAAPGEAGGTVLAAPVSPGINSATGDVAGSDAGDSAGVDTGQSEPVAEPSAPKRRGRPPKGTAVAKDAAPSPSEEIVSRFRVTFDDHVEAFDDLADAFERMQDFVEAAPDTATIDAFMKANEAWIAELPEKYGRLVGILNKVVETARAELAKPVETPAPAANDDGMAIPGFLKKGGTDESPAFPTLPEYTAEHARAALRAMAADRENQNLDSDQKRQAFLLLKMKDTGVAKISDIPADKLKPYVEGIVQALSAGAMQGLVEKWKEIK